MNRKAMALVSDPRRVVIYVIYDRRGEIEDYVLFALREMRAHAELIVAVVNGELTTTGRERLAGVADEIVVRENAGFDIWGHKAGIDHLAGRMEVFDELVLTNDTWFGPVRPYGPVFDRMASEPVHFWGMTDNVGMTNPKTGKGYVPDHLQSFWIAVRREMFLSSEWGAYWRDLPEMPGYFDAVLTHEVVFTEHFRSAGFTATAAFPAVDYPTGHPALFNADRLIADGCPLVKRRVFFHWPPYLDHNAVVGRWLADAMGGHGYPLELIYDNLARNVPPRDMHANLGMTDVLSTSTRDSDRPFDFRVIVVMHIFYVDMVDEMLDLADTLPGTYDLVITTQDEGRAAAIRDAVEARPREGRTLELRIVASNDGRDQSAFLITCRDILLSDRYDLVVKLHSKRTPQDGHNVGRAFKEQQFSNLLASTDYTANVLNLFRRESGLGLVFPPMVHIGYPTMGRAWWSNKAGAAQWCETLNVRVPLDDVSPLAPFGSMYIARPEALRLLVQHEWKFEDFGGREAYQDGGLAHILERLPSYVAGERGFHTRTIMTPEYAAESYTTLDFNFNEMSVTVPGPTHEQIAFLRGAGDVGAGRLRDFVRMYGRRNFPGWGSRLRALRAAVIEGARRVRVPLLRRGTGAPTPGR